MFLFQLKGTYGDPEAQHTFVAAGRMDSISRLHAELAIQYHVVLTIRFLRKNN